MAATGGEQFVLRPPDVPVLERMLGSDRRVVLGLGVRQMTDHVVTMPDRSPHRAVKFGDAMLLLMDTLTAVRAGTRLVVFDPLVRPDVCDACAAAYAEASRIIEKAGGLRAWAAKYQTPP